MNLDAINTSKIEMFRANINKMADDEIAELTAQIREKRNTAGKRQAEFATREALARVRAEGNAAATRFRKEFSRCDFETMKAVRAHRKELIDGFFEELRADLAEFAKSDKYEDYLKRGIEKSKSELGADCVIFAAVRDVERVRGLCKNEVRADKHILLGGVCALDEKRGLFGDLTLDKALEDEKSAFTDKAELRL